MVTAKLLPAQESHAVTPGSVQALLSWRTVTLFPFMVMTGGAISKMLTTHRGASTDEPVPEAANCKVATVGRMQVGQDERGVGGAGDCDVQVVKPLKAGPTGAEAAKVAEAPQLLVTPEGKMVTDMTDRGLNAEDHPADLSLNARFASPGAMHTAGAISYRGADNS